MSLYSLLILFIFSLHAWPSRAANPSRASWAAILAKIGLFSLLRIKLLLDFGLSPNDQQMLEFLISPISTCCVHGCNFRQSINPKTVCTMSMAVDEPEIQTSDHVAAESGHACKCTDMWYVRVTLAII